MAQKWAVFTSLKAKKTAQTKPYKTTLHTTGSEKQPARLASWICAVNSRKLENVKLESRRLGWKIVISPAESALSKICVALHGIVCSHRHSWHIRLATLSKSHLHRFICDDLRTRLFVNAPCPETYFTIKRRPAPKTTSSATNTRDKNERERN